METKRDRQINDTPNITHIKYFNLISKIVIIIGFIVVFLFLYSFFSNLMRPKRQTYDLVYPSIYKLEKNTVDVAFVGASTVYYGIQPNVLWNEFGITSCNVASAGQSIPCSYFIIQELLKYQNPKVLVLDAYATYYESLWYDINGLHSATDPLRLSPEKIKMLGTMLEEQTFDEKVPYYLTLDLYHSRWKELTDIDFYPGTFMKGSVFTHRRFDNVQIPVPEERADVHELVIEYFDKIAALCEEEGIKLVVIEIPRGLYTGDDWPTFTYDSYCINNTFFDYIDENYDIPYKYYSKTGELQLDFSNDYYDRTHLNIYGAEKLSLNIGKFIDDLYDLPDYRGEAGFEQWDIDYLKYLQVKGYSE